MSQKTKAIPMSKHLFSGLLPIIGNEKYDQVVARCRELFEKHELPNFPTLRQHLTEGVLPGLAFYQILRESRESRESALAIMDQAFEKLFSDKLAQMKNLGNLRFVYPFLRLYIKPAMRQYPQKVEISTQRPLKQSFPYSSISPVSARPSWLSPTTPISLDVPLMLALITTGGLINPYLMLNLRQAATDGKICAQAYFPNPQPYIGFQYRQKAAKQESSRERYNMFCNDLATPMEYHCECEHTKFCCYQF